MHTNIPDDSNSIGGPMCKTDIPEIELFYLGGCPYCRHAHSAIETLCAETPAYATIPIRWIEEREEPALAAARDYFRVPALFCGGEKLYEASPLHGRAAIREHIRSAFDRVLSKAQGGSHA